MFCSSKCFGLTLSRNPFNPGSGSAPPYLAGRKSHLARFEETLNSIEQGKPENLLMTGLRGTGKTVLLEEFHKICARRNFLAIKRLQFSKKYSDPKEFELALSYDVRVAVESFSRLRWTGNKAKAIIQFLSPKKIGIPNVVYYEPSFKKSERCHMKTS